MNASTVIGILRQALREPSKRAEHIRRFQAAVFKNDAFSGPIEDVIRDLAYDLDFYEPDERLRSQDPAYFDDDCAVHEIEQALLRIRSLSIAEESSAEEGNTNRRANAADQEGG